MADPLLQMHEVSHVYVNDKKAALSVEKFSLTVRSGQFVSIIGPSGCGKTTVLSIIAGLLVPAEGEVRLLGTPVTRPSGEVGYMLQQDYLFPWRTIMENTLIGLELTKKRSPESERYVMNLLQEMGLGNHVRACLTSCRAACANGWRSCARWRPNPNLLLLDEPFSALDYQTKMQLEDLVWKTFRERNKTALLVTHDIAEAIAMSDRIIVMDRNPGRIRREISVPDAIRETAPFKAREQAGFHELFHLIWKELEESTHEGGGSMNSPEHKIYLDHLRRKRKERIAVWLTQIIILTGFLAAWEIAGRLNKIDTLLFSYPSKSCSYCRPLRSKERCSRMSGLRWRKRRLAFCSGPYSERRWRLRSGGFASCPKCSIRS